MREQSCRFFGQPRCLSGGHRPAVEHSQPRLFGPWNKKRCVQIPAVITMTKLRRGFQSDSDWLFVRVRRGGGLESGLERERFWGVLGWWEKGMLVGCEVSGGGRF